MIEVMVKKMKNKAEKTNQIKKQSKKITFLSYIQKQFSKLYPLTTKKVFVFLLCISLFAFITYVYFKFTLLITPDGSQYYQNSTIFNGIKGLSNWNTRRTFAFPLILWLITKLFGDSIKGILFGFYLFYIFTLLFIIKFIRMLINENNLEGGQSAIWALFILFFLFNPLIIGWGHTLLTEAVIPYFFMLMIYLCIKWVNVEWKDRKKFILLNVGLIALSVFIYFIKERYAYTAWILFLITNIVSAIYKKSWKVFFQKSLVLLVAFVITIVSLNIWNFALRKEGNENTGDYASSERFKAQALSSNVHFRRVSKNTYCNSEYINDALVKEKENVYDFIESKGDSWCDYVIVYEIYDLKNRHTETEILLNKTIEMNYFDVAKIYFKNFTTHPILMLHAYYENFLGILNFEQVILDDKLGYYPSGEITSNARHENSNMGYAVFIEGGKNCWWTWDGIDFAYDDSLIENMDHFMTTTNSNSNLSAFMQILEQWSNITFMFSLLFSFPIFIYGLVMCVKHRNSISYFLITLLSGASFTLIMFHVLMQSLIDRYCYPAYPMMLLCLIILFMDKSQKYEV